MTKKNEGESLYYSFHSSHFLFMKLNAKVNECYTATTSQELIKIINTFYFKLLKFLFFFHKNHSTIVMYHIQILLQTKYLFSSFLIIRNKTLFTYFTSLILKLKLQYNDPRNLNPPLPISNTPPPFSSETIVLELARPESSVQSPSAKINYTRWD